MDLQDLVREFDNRGMTLIKSGKQGSEEDILNSRVWAFLRNVQDAPILGRISPHVSSGLAEIVFSSPEVE